MRKITQAIGAGETVYLPMCMSFMLIETASYECSFYFYGKNNQLNKEIVGFKDIFTVNAGKNSFFMKVGVYSAQAQTIEVVILDDDRVIYNKMSGSMTVTSPYSSPVYVNNIHNEYDSISKNRFIKGITSPAVSARYSSCHLCNPSGSGVMVIVDRVEVMSENSCIVGMNCGNSTIGSGDANNIYLGETRSKACFLTNYQSSFIDTDLGRWSTTSPYNNGRSYANIHFPSPFILEENWFVSFQGDVADSYFMCTFHWKEI